VNELNVLLVETNGAKRHLGIDCVEGIEVRPKAKSRSSEPILFFRYDVQHD
jgi:hypothetical protein